jgi:hypothetical protein
METPALGFAAEMAAFTISAKRSGYLYAGAGFAQFSRGSAPELYDATLSRTAVH